MRKIKVMFEKDPSVEGIEVTVRAPDQNEEVNDLIDKIEGRPSVLTVIGLDGTFINIMPEEIVLISVNGKMVNIITEKETHTVCQPLNSLENRLRKFRFVRISRYEIVNLAKVKKFDFTLSGTLRLELAGGLETWASRRQIPLIRKKLTERE